MQCCNFNCAAVLLNYIVTLVRLSLVTNKGYLLTYLHVTPVLETMFAPVLEPGQRFWSGRVKGQCVRPGFVVFARVLLLLLGENTPLWDSVYSAYNSCPARVIYQFTA